MTLDYRWSAFGEKLTGHSGIMELMEDLGQAMAGQRDTIMMGGGNPAHIPEVQQIWRACMQDLLDNGAAYDRMLANYDPPRGNAAFIRALIACLNQHYGWNLTPANVAVTNGGQTAFFFMLNLLAGRMPDGSWRRILLPLCPEYIGYADQGLTPGLFTARRPLIEEIDRHTFKYRIDFEHLALDDDIAAVCVSRPTNPTGNVLTDAEIAQLRSLTARHGIPLIIDNAYGAPFPQIVFDDVTPVWDENMIVTLSLSKLGLPATRTGIVIAAEPLIHALTSLNAIIGLANGGIGQILVTPLLENGELLRISREIIRPYYRKKSQHALALLEQHLGDELEYRVHKSEGALFLWLWFKGLPITTRELYERLKKRNVLVVPGSYFFYGLDQPWNQEHECIRMTYSQTEDQVARGIAVLADELRIIGHS